MHPSHRSRRPAADVGIRQFLDVGTGLPTADNTDEVAQRAAPTSRTVYVDNDPVVLAHARATQRTQAEFARLFAGWNLIGPVPASRRSVTGNPVPRISCPARAGRSSPPSPASP